MRLPFVSLLTACTMALTPAAPILAQSSGLPQGSADFRLITANDGKTVGSANCTVTAVLGGFQADSHAQMRMAKFSYSFTNSDRFDPSLNIVHDQLTGTVNGSQVTFSMASDSSGRQFSVNIAAQGKNTANTFDRHQRTVLLPDLDPAAYLEMAAFALQHPPTAWVVIPKQNGILVPANYEPQPDAEGIFHGQPITVHHTSVAVNAENGISAEIYYTSEGQLLEADLPEQNFYVIRDGFVLKNRPQYKPPQGAPPSNPQEGSPQQPQQPQ
ncbi:MAG TPA: hypothetical protein VMD25_05195 [Acidobacteriaceae bacterium]|nr:hypothetical protein [Acidobacteriaceae bacterium]